MKPVYIGLLILDISKVEIYEYWYDYTKKKYGGNAKLWYTDTNSFILHVKFKDVYEGLAGDVKTRLDISNYKVEILQQYKMQHIGALHDPHLHELYVQLFWII